MKNTLRKILPFLWKKPKPSQPVNLTPPREEPARLDADEEWDFTKSAGTRTERTHKARSRALWTVSARQAEEVKAKLIRDRKGRHGALAGLRPNLSPRN